jgi:hypothetical protein
MNDAWPIARAQAAETVSRNAVCQGLHELAEMTTLQELGLHRCILWQCADRLVTLALAWDMVTKPVAC